MDHRRAQSRHHGFAVVLVLVLVSVAFQVAAPDTDWSRFVTIALGAAILIVSTWAAQARRTLVRGAALFAGLLALAALVVLIATGDVPKATAALANGLLVASLPPS